MFVLLFSIFVYVGIIFFVLIVIGVILIWFYWCVIKDVVLICMGFGGEKVVFNGGIMVIFVLYELMQVCFFMVKFEVLCFNKDVLIIQDKLCVDVVGLFYIKVKFDVQLIVVVVQMFGDLVNNLDVVKLLFDGKLVLVLCLVVVMMMMEYFYVNCVDFIQKVQEVLMIDLDMNGFQLELVSIIYFGQMVFEYFNENNVFDVEGLIVFMWMIEECKKICNDIVVINCVEIE